MGAGETNEAKSSYARKGDGRNEEVRMRRDNRGGSADGLQVLLSGTGTALFCRVKMKYFC